MVLAGAYPDKAREEAMFTTLSEGRIITKHIAARAAIVGIEAAFMDQSQIMPPNRHIRGQGGE